jgi:hypothetical protein
MLLSFAADPSACGRTNGKRVFIWLPMDLAMICAHSRPMRHLFSALALIIAAVPLPATAQDWAGEYRLDAGPDVAGALELNSDGTFRFGLSAGALDTEAAGSWTHAGDGITLRTEPRPAAPVFTLARSDPGPGDGTISVNVTWPNGRGIAGIDFHILREGAEPIEDYTQRDGWTSEPGPDHPLLSIELSEPIHGIVSPEFAVPANARAFTFVLTPNGMGMADFDDAPAERTADGLTLHWRGGELPFVRATD